MKHPAFNKSFDEMYAELYAGVNAGTINVQKNQDGLELFTYSKDCVMNRDWNYATMIARGLILDSQNKKIIGLPFPKFFNYGENVHATIPAGEYFETFEKLDGSLIVVFHHNNRWQAATKGSFNSDQAQWAQSQLDKQDLDMLHKNTTYLCEAIYPENRIVIHYNYSGLVLLGAYNNITGRELDLRDLVEDLENTGWRFPKIFEFKSLQEPLDKVPELSNQEEGFVLRFQNGHRVKIKGSEYKRIHAIIARLTPLGIYDMIVAKDDLLAVRKDIPEEFWIDFDKIVDLLKFKFYKQLRRVQGLWQQTRFMTDKEVGLSLDNYPKDIRRYLFPMRKATVAAGQTRDQTPFEKVHEMIWRDLRPTGNKLEGYVPSFVAQQDDDI